MSSLGFPDEDTKSRFEEMAATEFRVRCSGDALHAQKLAAGVASVAQPGGGPATGGTLPGHASDGLSLTH